MPSQDIEQEDYEIPIVSTTPIHRENSELSDSSFHSVISGDIAAGNIKKSIIFILPWEVLESVHIS